MEEFRLMVEICDPNNQKDIDKFVYWIKRAAMGEDSSIDEVHVGYIIEDTLSYDSDGAKNLAKDTILKYKPIYHDIYDLLKEFL